MKFKIYTLETAPKDSQPLLEGSLKMFGMIPNLHAVMAESPSILEAYQLLHKLFQNTSFDADELTVVWQTINIEHECHYCVPAHSAVADMMKVDPSITGALRSQTELSTKKLQVLHQITLALVRNRGHLNKTDIAAFTEAGYQHRQLLEIILGISQKVMSNYVNHLAQTPIDEAFVPYI